jgi:hypothetical protein
MLRQPAAPADIAHDRALLQGAHFQQQFLATVGCPGDIAQFGNRCANTVSLGRRAGNLGPHRYRLLDPKKAASTRIVIPP